MNHADVDHGLAGFGVAFVIFAVTAATAEPREGAFDDPTFRQQHEAVISLRSPDEFEDETQRLESKESRSIVI